MPEDIGRYCQIEQDHGLDKALDIELLLDLCRPTLENGEPVAATLPIKNTNRVVGTILGSEVTRPLWGRGLAGGYHPLALPRGQPDKVLPPLPQRV